MRTLSLLCLGVWGALAAAGDEAVGKRPYEMEWAGRTADRCPALIDFEKLDGWTVSVDQAVASLTRSREQQLWGRYVAKLTYRGLGAKPVVVVKPPQPVPIVGRFDCLNFWVYGNNWAWVVDETTPRVQIALMLRGPDGRRGKVAIGMVRWREWWVMHHRLSPEQLELYKPGTLFEGIEITGGRNSADRTLYFDNLAAYVEALPALTYAPRPKRAIALPTGQTVGTNIGPGVLPFPNCEETILPDNLAIGFQTGLEKAGDAFVFRYKGPDAQVVYRYQPRTGTLGDISVECEGFATAFQPMSGGGLCFAPPGKEVGQLPTRVELLSCRQTGQTVEAVWRCHWEQGAAEVKYAFRLWQKSLVIDVQCLGGAVAEVRFGKAVGASQPRLTTVPFLVGAAQRPAVLVMGPPERSCFLSSIIDHCRTNASSLWFVNSIDVDGTAYNGGTRYRVKTDGVRNPCFERLFLTVSPRFEEVLPNVPNPKSPWMQVTSQRVWRAHGASQRDRDYAFWKQIARHGMSQVLITDHETGWRDGGESFTLRTRAAPGRGGDESQADYARKIHALGFRYGIYNNYTDYAPVNEHWNEDYVTRTSDNEWLPAWARCYNLKPSRAVELEARLAPVIQSKFHLDTAYCDVHTAVSPWQYCDFDARVPGAATLAATFYAYGEIMLHQKATWNGPVYSEGNNHWYYCGLTDGNYGQDQAGRLSERPWLVDFDLRKLHPLCCNFGMGNLDMFYTRGQGNSGTPDERSQKLDRFLAATLAFGHTGFLVTEGGLPSAARSYFMLQQLHARYALDTVAQIRYADQQGRLFETSAAVANDAYKRSQLVIHYRDGLELTVNGHASETWTTPDAMLPPNGWSVRDPRGQLVAWSKLVDGHRADYISSPAYVYADGRGQVTRFPQAVCDGPLVVLPQPDGGKEVIPFAGCKAFGVACDGRTATAEALDADRNSLGPGQTRFSRGLVYVTPVPNAVSYRLKLGDRPAAALTCPRTAVVPGERATVRGAATHEVTIPADAKVGALLWREFEGAWIDFAVLPLADARLKATDKLHLEFDFHGPTAVEAQVRMLGATRTVKMTPGGMSGVDFPLPTFTRDEIRPVSVTVACGSLTMERKWRLQARTQTVPLAQISDVFTAGQRLRKGAERPLGDESGAHVYRQKCRSGGVEAAGLAMHPPYKHGVGYVFATFDPIVLPKSPPAALRTQVGKVDGSDPGDGILYRAAVFDADGRETVVAEKHVRKHAWTPIEADLSRWAGKQVRIKLIGDVGPADNSSGDWACWADPQIENLAPQRVITVLHE